SEEDRRYVDIIKRNADRLGYIIQDLLVLSELEDKGQAVLAEEVDLPALVERATPLFKERLGEKNLAFTSRIDPDLPVIQGDAFRLEQMLINLIDNAIKYTEKGSITLSLSRKEDRVEIVVEDTGIGIPSEHLSRIFERFYVVDKS